MGRGKVELKKIENPTNRQVTFSKRRTGLLKKANELAILCDAQVGVIIFSGSGRMYEYASPPWRIANIFDRYLKSPSTRFEEMDIQQKIIHEMTRMKDEHSRLSTIMRQYMGEDLAPLPLQDLTGLEQRLEFSLYKLHLRKQQLLDQQLLEMRHRDIRVPEDQGDHLMTQAGEMLNPKAFPWWDAGCSHQQQQQQAQQLQLYGHGQQGGEPSSMTTRTLQVYGGGQQEAAEPSSSMSTALQLSPQLHEYTNLLQPVQPNLQGYVLRL